MFEKAARQKLRFPFRGSISVEDLWDLSVQELDGLYSGLNKRLKESQEESLLSSVKKRADSELQLQVDIIKHIVEVKLQETLDKEQAAEKRDKKRKLMDLISQKKDSELQNKSIEDLQKMMDEI